MMTKPHPHQDITKKGLIIPLITVLLFSLCTSSSTTKRQKEEIHPNKSTLFKNYYDKTTFKVKDENGKVIADKKYADLTVKEKTLPPFIYNKTNL
jgi:hypothetical protein